MCMEHSSTPLPNHCHKGSARPDIKRLYEKILNMSLGSLTWNLKAKLYILKSFLEPAYFVIGTRRWAVSVCIRIMTRTNKCWINVWWWVILKVLPKAVILSIYYKHELCSSIGQLSSSICICTPYFRGFSFSFICYAALKQFGDHFIDGETLSDSGTIQGTQSDCLSLLLIFLTT